MNDASQRRADPVARTDADGERGPRPIGVVILASLMLLAGIIEIVSALDLGGDPARVLEGITRAPAGIPLWIPLTISVIRIVTAIGLWLMRRWAWGLAVLVTGLILTADLAAWARGVHYELSMLVSVVIVLYLNQSAVRAAFDRGGRGGDADAARTADAEPS